VRSIFKWSGWQNTSHFLNVEEAFT